MGGTCVTHPTWLNFVQSAKLPENEHGHRTRWSKDEEDNDELARDIEERVLFKTIVSRVENTHPRPAGDASPRFIGRLA